MPNYLICQQNHVFLPSVGPPFLRIRQYHIITCNTGVYDDPLHKRCPNGPAEYCWKTCEVKLNKTCRKKNEEKKELNASSLSYI